MGCCLSLGIAACGGSSTPANVVASVAGNPISLQAYNHWLYIAALEESAGTGKPVIVPQTPPEFTSCVAQIRRDVPSLSTTPDSTLKTQCSQVFKESNTEVMEFLIEAYWYQADAYRMGINYTTADLNHDFQKTMMTEFPTTSELKAYLMASGETKADLLFQIRVSQIYSKLVKRLGSEKAVNAQATRLYRTSTYCKPTYKMTDCSARARFPNYKPSSG
jgi:hypothetical protein